MLLEITSEYRNWVSKHPKQTSSKTATANIKDLGENEAELCNIF
jgi:hypothetical protein